MVGVGRDLWGASSPTPLPKQGLLWNMLGKTVWVSPVSGKGKPVRGTAFAQGPGCPWWVMRKDGEVRCVPHRDLILGENSQ